MIWGDLIGWLGLRHMPLLSHPNLSSQAFELINHIRLSR
jgi:hypothetical protein